MENCGKVSLQLVALLFSCSLKQFASGFKLKDCDHHLGFPLCVIHGMHGAMRDSVGKAIGHESKHMKRIQKHSDDILAKATEMVEKRMERNKYLIEEDEDVSCGKNGPAFKHMEKIFDLMKAADKYTKCPKGCSCEGSCMTCESGQKRCDGAESMFFAKSEKKCKATGLSPWTKCGAENYRPCVLNRCPPGFACDKLVNVADDVETDESGCCPTATFASPVGLDGVTDQERCDNVDPVATDNSCTTQDICPENSQCTLAEGKDGICCPTDNVDGIGRPTITTFMEGSTTTGSTSAYYVKADGISVFIDLGRSADVSSYFEEASKNDSLCSVDFIILTSCRGDVTGASPLVAGIPIIDCCGNMHYKDNMWPTPLATDDKKLLLHSNVQIVKTPTSQSGKCADQSVYVHNVEEKGTVVFSGGVMRDESDVAIPENNAMLADSKQRVICTANEICPGNGKCFSVIPDVRSVHGCPRTV